MRAAILQSCGVWGAAPMCCRVLLQALILVAVLLWGSEKWGKAWQLNNLRPKMVIAALPRTAPTAGQ